MQKFENIVIATDLDGTYFGNSVRLVPRNLERVKYFCENGGHFTFNTGRLPIFMRKSLPNAKELINMPAITGNGTCLYDFHNEMALTEHFVDHDAIVSLVNFVNEYTENAGFRGVTRGGFVIHDLENPYNKHEYEYFPSFMEKQIMPIEHWGELELYKVNMFDTPEMLERLFLILRKEFSHCLTVTRAGRACIEIMPKGTSKAIMLKETVERLFDRPMTICTVGDYDNDLEMHAIADLSVCPSNANERVKAVCKACLCSNDEGVIGDLVDMLDKAF